MIACVLELGAVRKEAGDQAAVGCVGNVHVLEVRSKKHMDVPSLSDSYKEDNGP